jgi:hypothetical protein
VKEITISEALDDPGLFRPALGKQVESWKSWRGFHKCAHGLPLDEPEEIQLFQKCTARPRVLTSKPDEVFAIVGRRGGKSISIAIEAVYTCLIDTFWKPYLAQGEKAFFIIIAVDKIQCRIIMNYIRGFIQGNKLFRSQVESETQEELSFKNGSVISIRAANFRSIRGPAFCGCACDEIAFWRSEDTSANPAAEILDAVRPALIPGSTLFGISSAYAKQGILFDEWQQNFGKETETLIWVADTKTMNPLFDQKKIDKAMRKDSSVARAEYFSLFRDDLEGVFTRAAIEQAVIPGRQELPPAAGVHYKAFVDPSGGRHDSFTLAIGHAEGRLTVIDLSDEVKAPFSPAAVVSRFADTLKQYGIHKVVGDRYAGSWPSDAFAKYDIRYEASEKTASEIYLELVPRLSNGEIELPENERLQAQFLSLLRRTGTGGKDSVITPQGSDSHADLANAVAGVAFIIKAGKKKRTSWDEIPGGFYGNDEPSGNYSRLQDALYKF